VKAAKQPRPQQDGNAATPLQVVLIPAATPEEADARWQKLLQVLDWVATIGATDA
jgi:hypothetical protein